MAPSSPPLPSPNLVVSPSTLSEIPSSSESEPPVSSVFITPSPLVSNSSFPPSITSLIPSLSLSKS